MSIDTTGALPNGAQPVTGGAALRTAIAWAFAAYSDAAHDATDTRAVAKAAAETGLSKKEQVIVATAQHAAAGGWDSEEVKSAVATEIKSRKEQGDRSAGALATFGSEVRKFLAPAVRPYVAVFFAIARDAIDNETALKAVDSDASTPVTKAFAKAYHAAFNLAKHVAEKHGGERFTTAADIQMFAIAWLRARDINADRVLKRLKKLTDELRAFNADFDLEAITDAIDVLGDVTKPDIEQALRDKVVIAPEPAPAPVVTPVAPAPEGSDPYDAMISDTIAQAA